ncbi:hypothetical protein RCL1_002750 [Eukaryota sp. TZLM3-RCL]
MLESVRTIPSKDQCKTASCRRWSSLSRSLHFTRFALLFDIIVMSLVFVHAAFVDERLNQYTSIESSSDIAMILWIQVILAFVQAVVAVVCLITYETAIKARSDKLLHRVLLIKSIFLLLDLFLFAYPNPFRSVLAFIAVIIHTFTCLSIYLMISTVSPPPLLTSVSVPSPLANISSNTSLSPELLSALTTQKRLYQYVELEQTRKRWGKVADKRSVFLLFSLLVMALIFGTFFAEFIKLFSFQGFFFTDQQLEKMNDYESVFDHENGGYWPQDPSATTPVYRAHTNNKVIVFIVDGLRWDYFDPFNQNHDNEELKNLINDPDFSKDMKYFEGKCLLPSFSVPNWMTLLTGSTPELLGVIGNLMIPDTKFDSVFRVARLSETMNGLTASPWMRDIIASQLKALSGDGTVSTSFNADSSDSAHEADEERARYLQWAVNLRGQDPLDSYQLFYAHFSDVDLRGHCCGVTKEYNKEDSYNEATTSKTNIFKNLIDSVDDDTVVIFVSDHGQVDVGGHGGYLADSDIISKVPIMIYKKNSNFNSFEYSGPSSKTSRHRTDYSLEDVAPTVSALLGLPIPRGASGMVIDEALNFVPNIDLVYRDLYEQKKVFVSTFLSRSGYSHEINSNDHLSGKIDGSTLTNEQLVDAVGSMLEVFESVRNDYHSMQMMRNILVSILIVVLVIIGYIFITSKFSVVSFRQLLSTRSINSDYTLPNRKAFFTALLLVISYFVISIPIFFILNYLRGYEQIDATLVHTPAAIPALLGTMFVPGIIGVFIVSRVPYFMVSRPKSEKNDGFFVKIFNYFIYVFGFGDSVYTTNNGPQFLLLVQEYVLFFVIVCLLLLGILMSSFSFIVPKVFRIPFVEGNSWNFRFKILAIILQSIPLALTCFFQAKNINELEDGPSENDHVYNILIKKFKAVHSSNSEFLKSLDRDALILSEGNTDMFRDISNASDLLVDV